MKKFFNKLAYCFFSLKVLIAPSFTYDIDLGPFPYFYLFLQSAFVYLKIFLWDWSLSSSYLDELTLSLTDWPSYYSSAHRVEIELSDFFVLFEFEVLS